MKRNYFNILCVCVCNPYILSCVSFFLVYKNKILKKKFIYIHINIYHRKKQTKQEREHTYAKNIKMLLSKTNNTGQSYFENTGNKLTQSYNAYNDYKSNIEAELAKLKEEEKLLQTVLEIKIRSELINHLERDKEVESIKNTSILNNSLHSNQDPDLEVKNMTTTHNLLHRITNECPICEKNSVNSLIISSSNERNLNKSNSGTNAMLKFQNKPEPEKPKPNVVSQINFY